MTAKPWLHNPNVTLKIQEAIAKLQAQGVTEITASTIKKATSGVHRATIAHRMEVTYKLHPVRMGTTNNRLPYRIYSLADLKDAVGC